MRGDTVRMIFGYGVLAVLASLAVVIGLGKVEEKSSFGLNDIISILAVLAGAFAQWAFSSRATGSTATPKTLEDSSDESQSKAQVHAQGTSL
jgi:hypothetical protein